MDAPPLVVPDYGGSCLAGIVPALLHRAERQPPVWIPEVAAGAAQVVLLVLDGLGWEQLQARTSLAPTLAAMSGGPITSVAPTTTATALASLTTGRTPAEHGVMGYRVHVGDGQVMNVLRWTTPAGDARVTVPPAEFHPLPPGSALVVTADHGQVHVGEQIIAIDDDVLAETTLLSGEGRFRWLHARPGRAEWLAAEAGARYGDVAWVRTRAELEEMGCFGGPLSPTAAARLGDVALIPFEPVAFLDPSDTGETRLVSRHGSLTSAELLVPLVAVGG